MKFKNVVVTVVALHAVVLGALFFMPGCSQTTSSVPVAKDTEAGFVPPSRPGAEVSMGTSASTAINGEVAQPLPSGPELAPLPQQSGETVSYTVAKGDSLWKIAKKHGTTISAITAANNLGNAGVIHPGMHLNIPAGAKLTSAAECPVLSSEEAPKSGVPYVVQKGDTLGKIAHLCGISVAELKAANHLTKNTILVGQKLSIPAKGSIPAAKVEAKNEPSASVSADGVYVVRSGDSLAKIAKRTKTKTTDLIAWNNIKNPERLQIGQKLHVRGAAPAAPVVEQKVATQAEAVASPSVETLPAATTEAAPVITDTTTTESAPAAATSEVLTPEESEILSGAQPSEVAPVQS